MSDRPATLRLFQGLSVAVLRRDAIAAQQGLRLLTDAVDDREGETILRLLVSNLSPHDRFWFGNLHGPRIGLEDPAAGNLKAA